MTKRLPRQQREALDRFLKELADMVREAGVPSRVALRLLLEPSGLATDWAIGELKRWAKALNRVRGKSKPVREDAVRRSLMARGVPEAYATLAVETVTGHEFPPASRDRPRFALRPIVALLLCACLAVAALVVWQCRGPALPAPSSTKPLRGLVLTQTPYTLTPTRPSTDTPVRTQLPGATAQPPASISDVISTSRTYEVKAGDTLWEIAERFYGDGRKWRLIAEASQIEDPKTLRAGMILTIPHVQP